MKKNEILTLEVSAYAFEGKGISKISLDKETSENFIVFLDHAYPGDIVKAEIKKIKKNYADAKVTELIKASQLRDKPICKYFMSCGGCKQQDLHYQFQLQHKQQQVIELFDKIGGIKEIQILPIIASEEKYFYRNKMEFSFSNKRWLDENEVNIENIDDKDFALGLHSPKNYQKVVDIEECFLQSELSKEIVNESRKFFKEKKVEPYAIKEHTGFLRNLVIRQSKNFPDIMVNLVTAKENNELNKMYGEFLNRNFPQVTTFVNNINSRKAAVAVGEFEKVIFGDGYIYDSIGNYRFRISANSFFQTNTKQAEKLYDAVVKVSELNEGGIIYDLYSGTGTISNFVSKYAKKVIGFEVVESSVTDAKFNSKLNNTTNTQFYSVDLYKSMLPIIESENIPLPDVVISDPPRGGMHVNTIRDVIHLKPKKIIYISCNPATQARDVKLFEEGGYKAVVIQPVDMFPQTYHIENICLLEKNN